MPRRRALAFVSVLVHAVVFTIIIVAELTAIGPLPALPQQPLAFEGARMVRLEDITLPPTPRRGSDMRDPAMASPANAAPIVAPEGVAPETGREGLAAPRALPGIERGGGGLDGIGRVEGTPPPPPPPPTPPTTPTRLSGGMQPPRKIVDVVPAYPPLARTAHIEGVVVLEVVIDARGGVESVRVLRSIPMLDQAAVDAVREWRFTPTLLSGQPIPIVMTVTVNFTLGR
jgi:protein TonB